MSQGHTLGSPCASAGVEYQGNVVPLWLVRGNTGRSAHEMNVTCLAHLHRKHWNLTVEGRRAHVFSSDRRTKQNAGVGVAEKKKKLLVGVCRVQRGRGAG